MITLENLNYAYRQGYDAISDVSAEIGPGIHLLLGENGAGKTTLLHIIAGLRRPPVDTQCMIDGMAPSKRLPEVMSRVFLVSDEMKFPFASIDEMEKRHSVFYPNFNHEMLHRNLENFGMTGREPIDSFSLGNRKKAILAYAFALQTEVLLLDEPANGLDITARQSTLAMMAECVNENQTVIISTHSVFDFKQLFESVIMISAGRLILNIPLWEVSERLDFVNEALPPEGAIYMEPFMGRFRAIVPHIAGREQTDVDFLMLYSGLQSASRQLILDALNTQTSNTSEL